jgi:hypothetical protein
MSGGTFTMNGGSITGNSATTSAGGVYVGGGTFNWNGGTIISNGTTNVANTTGTLIGWTNKPDWQGTFSGYGPPPAGTAYPVWSGSGSSAANAIAITSQSELQGMRDSLTLHYALAKDITISGNWEPVGKNSSNQFKGELNGNGHKINFSSVTMQPETGATKYYGLFGYSYDNSEIHDFSITGSISCSLDGTTMNYAGGISGYHSGTGQIYNCAVNCTINAAAGAYDTHLGGIVGQNNATIKNCYTSRNITLSGSTGNKYLGGIAGLYNAGGIIQYCYSEGTINGPTHSTVYTGGIAGMLSTGTISNCVALNDDIHGYNTRTGRVIGSTSGTASNNFGLASMEFNGTPNSWAENNMNGKAVTVPSVDSFWTTPVTTGPGWTINATGSGTPSSPWEWGNGRPKLYWE